MMKPFPEHGRENGWRPEEDARLLPTGARVAVRTIVAVVAFAALLAVHASVFGGPLKPFFCELAGREMSRNGEYCIGSGLGWG